VGFQVFFVVVSKMVSHLLFCSMFQGKQILINLQRVPTNIKSYPGSRNDTFSIERKMTIILISK
jgi:hypothetical protein